MNKQEQQSKNLTKISTNNYLTKENKIPEESDNSYQIEQQFEQDLQLNENQNILKFKQFENIHNECLKYKNEGYIYIVKADLTTENVDSIVNASNGRLKFEGRLQEAIIQKAGSQIQDECSQIIGNLPKNMLEQGQAAITSAGKMDKLKNIIHAVGPIWNSGDTEPMTLYQAILNSLNLANIYGLESISFPAISSGVCGFPKKLCAEIFFSAIKYYFEQGIQQKNQKDSQNQAKNSLKYIRFVNFDQETTQFFQDQANFELKRHNSLWKKVEQQKLELQENQNVQDKIQNQQQQQQQISILKYLQNSYLSNNKIPTMSVHEYDIDQTIEKQKFDFLNENLKKFDNKHELVYNYRNQGLVYIVKADITSENTEAIVNAANTHLILGGGVAGAISRKGGYVIQKECSDITSRLSYQQLYDGQAAITSSGNMKKLKYVVHAVGPVWKDGKEEPQMLFNAILNSLYLAELYGVESISFPAISSGIFGFPKDMCAQIFFQAIKFYFENQIKKNSYNNNNDNNDKNKGIKFIRLVNFDEPTKQVFYDEAKSEVNKFKQLWSDENQTQSIGQISQYNINNQENNEKLSKNQKKKLKKQKQQKQAQQQKNQKEQKEEQKSDDDNSDVADDNDDLDENEKSGVDDIDEGESGGWSIIPSKTTQSKSNL